MDIKEVSKMIKDTEDAVKQLNEFEMPQIGTKGKTILEQIRDYITEMLINCKGVICSCSAGYNDGTIDSRCINFQVRDDSYIYPYYLYINGVPIIGWKSASNGFESKFDNQENLTEYQIKSRLEALNQQWGNMKEQLRLAITKEINKRQEDINRKVQDLAYLNTLADSFKI